ncbi:RsmD family RNA methyltransferase [Cerasicoccus frondis]|uniref:RsmD family RNA methyltransferase n=1 Tax=Cerasicoccus frondis TaxID=490090 RepID=UPI0028526EF3|nr:RsmD family RNA methyltransferase [Cerasicoccus frondis]
MRITGGQARGIPIKAPDRGVRPATDYLREAVFSSLGPARVEGARVLDCFAGTGAYGLEALSRGAQMAVFVEQDRGAQKCWEQNRAAVAKALQLPPESATDLRRGDFFKILARGGETFDLIFADPPYELWETRGADILEAVFGRLADSPEARIVCEAPGAWQPTLPAGWTLHRRLAKGPRQPSALIIGRSQEGF